MISREVQSIVAFASSTGIDFRVTDVNTPGIHTPKGWHYRQGTGGVGTAVDLAGPVSWHVDPKAATPILRALYAAFKPLRDAGLVVELLGPGDPDHDDHVHVAVRPGTFLVPLKKENRMTNPTIVAAAVTPSGNGYYLFAADGAVYTFGDAEYRGALQVVDGHFVLAQ